MKGTFEIKRTSDGKFLFNLKAGNEQVILTSQTYQTRESAEEGIASVRQNAPLNDRFEEKISEGGGHPYFVLNAANNQVIGKSQMYSSREAMRHGIASVKTNAAIAEIVDFSTPVRSAGGHA